MECRERQSQHKVKWTDITIHGFPRIFAAKSPGLLRIFWAIVTLVCFSAMVVLSWFMWQEYRAVPLGTSTSWVYRTTSSFPAVKICNRIQLDPQRILNDSTSSDQLIKILKIYATNDTVEFGFGSDIVTMINTNMYTSFSDDFARSYSFRITDYVLRCTYIGLDINCDEIFEPFILPTYGMCYKLVLPTPFSQEGSLSGLDLYFYSELGRDFGLLSPMVGASVIVGREEDVNTDDFIHISPGEQVLLRVEKSNFIQEESWPKLPCSSSHFMVQEYSGQTVIKRYNRHTCKLYCNSEYMHKITGCNAFLGINRDQHCLDDDEIRRQKIRIFEHRIKFIEEESRAISKQEREYIECVNRCVPACNQDVYDVNTQRSSGFPNDQFMQYLLSVVNATSYRTNAAKKLIHIFEGDQKLVRDIAKRTSHLKVYVKDDAMEKEVRIFRLVSTSSFLGSIGGSLGLLMGISVVSMVELLEHIVCSLYISTGRKCRSSWLHNWF